MHDQTVPPLLRALTQLRHVLAKADSHAQAHAWDPNVLLGLRLAPDMFPLIRQVQISTDVAKNAVARLSRIDAPKFEDDETGFNELDARIARALEFIGQASAEALAGADTREIVVPSRRGELRFLGHDYLYDFVLPNVHFHSSIAYALLRQAGVPLGKADFLGPIGGAA